MDAFAALPVFPTRIPALRGRTRGREGDRGAPPRAGRRIKPKGPTPVELRGRALHMAAKRI